MPVKKARSRPAAKKQEEAIDDDEEVPVPKKARGRSVRKEAPKAEAVDEEEAPEPKKARGRTKKAAPKEEEVEDEVEAEDAEEEEAPKPKSGKKAAADATVKAPQKRYLSSLPRAIPIANIHTGAGKRRPMTSKVTARLSAFSGVLA
jgi:hypothetical protein